MYQKDSVGTSLRHSYVLSRNVINNTNLSYKFSSTTASSFPSIDLKQSRAPSAFTTVGLLSLVMKHVP